MIKNPSSRFKALPIGTIFHTGKSYGVGASAKIAYWLEWRKDDKSHAVCVNQIGYGNDRAVGMRNPFAPNAVVFEVAGLQKNPSARSEIQRLKREQQEIAEDCNFCINRMQEQGDLAARCDKHNAIFHKQWQKLGVE